MENTETGPIPPKNDEAGDRGPRIDQLYHETQALKMSWIRKFLQEDKELGKISEAETARLSSLILKAIEVQIRILNEREKENRRGSIPEMEVIWKAMLKVSELQAILSKESVRRKIIAALDPDEEDENN